MASQNNIVRLADFPRQSDPALVARDRMNAAKSDDEYESARSALVRAVPRTMAGARAKHTLGMMLINSLHEGDELLPRGWKEMVALLSAVDQFVERAA